MMPGIRPLQPLTLLRALSQFIIRKLRKNKRKAIFSENTPHLDDTSPFSGNIYPPLVIQYHIQSILLSNLIVFVCNTKKFAIQPFQFFSPSSSRRCFRNDFGKSFFANVSSVVTQETRDQDQTNFTGHTGKFFHQGSFYWEISCV